MVVNREDEKWLKKALKECFGSSSNKATKDKRSLEGFSMLVRNMVNGLKKEFVETQALWKKNPASGELKDKFESLARRLFYLERYCREKIERELSEKQDD